MERKMNTITKKEGDKKMTHLKEIWKKASILAVAGGLAFWLANFAISLTPIAAEYRAALSISYFPMLLESLIAGLIIGFCVSYFLLRFFDKVPTQNPILKSVILSFIVLIIVTISIGGPSSFLATSDVLRYFLIGTMFNVIRILALGIGIGYLYRRLYKGFDPSANASMSAQAE
jgi:NhaP-type Na+/H+ and K+/H+ antiporter